MSPSSVSDVAHAVCSQRTHLRITSKPEWVDPIVEYLRQQAVSCGLCSTARSQKLSLVLREALLNALIHGNLQATDVWPPPGSPSLEEYLTPFTDDPLKASRTIDIVVDYDGRRCQWTFTDEGPGFNVLAVFRQQEGPQPPEHGSRGRGIWIMRAFMDEVRYEKGGRMLHLVLSRSAQPEPQLSLRVPLETPIDVVPIADSGIPQPGAAFKAVCYSLSDLGAVLLQREATASARVILMVRCDDRLLQIPAVLTHAQQLDADLTEAAYRFAAPLDPEGPLPALDALALPASLSTNAEPPKVQPREPKRPRRERRAYPRVTFTERVTIMGELDTHFAFARDLSRGGIALITTFPLPLHQIRVLRIPQAQGPAILTAARIVRCTAIMDGFFDVGAQFVDSDAS